MTAERSRGGFPRMPIFAYAEMRLHENPAGLLGDQREPPQTPAHPLFPASPGGGREGVANGRRGEAATAVTDRPISPPTGTWGEIETEPTPAGVKRPTIRRRIGGRRDGRMPGATFARRRPHQRAEGGRRPSRSDRSEAEPESARRRSRGAKRGIQGGVVAIGRKWPWEAIRLLQVGEQGRNRVRCPGGHLRGRAAYSSTG